MTRPRERGFTLLELLVVLAVLSLVLAIGVPRLVNALPGVETKRAATELATALKEARFEAIRSSLDTALVVDLAERRYRLRGKDRSHNLPSGLELKLTVASGVGANDRTLGDRSGEIAFYPDGSSSGGRIALSQGGHAYHVEVDWLTGRVSLDPQ